MEPSCDVSDVGDWTARADIYEVEKPKDLGCRRIARESMSTQSEISIHDTRGAR